MKTILLIISICLNCYLFYKFIKERLEKIDYRWMYNRTQCDVDNVQKRLNHLKEINDDLESQVTEILRKRHE